MQAPHSADRQRSPRITRCWLGVTSLLTLLCMPLAHADGARITVYAAASLSESMRELARQYEAASGDKVVVSLAASSTLAKQIENGAPADLFISADLDWMDYLGQRKLIVEGSRVNLLSNRLVLIAPATSRDLRTGLAPLTISHGFALAEKLGSDELAMANPDHVPAGRYGKAALQRLGVWHAVQAKVAATGNVRAALSLVSRAEAPYGIVYRTDALADRNVRIVDTFPADAHPPIVYPAALITGGGNSAPEQTAAARRLLDYLGSKPARPIWQKYGFGVPTK